MKGYYIDITNNLLDTKHYVAMKESVWLFMWFLDKMTSISEDGIGKVLGGKPIIASEFTEEIGINEKTYRRWVKILRKGGYINTLRTPRGLVITINKAKKQFGKRDRTNLSIPNRSDRTFMGKGSDIFGVVNGQIRASNIRQYKDNTKTTGGIKIPLPTTRINEGFKKVSLPPTLEEFMKKPIRTK